MAATLQGATLTEAHRLALARLGQRATLALHRAWALLDPFDLDATVGRWLDATLPIVQAHHVQAVAEGETYYRRFRTAELVGLGDVASAAAVPEAAQDALSLSKLRRDLTITGPVAIKAGTARGLSVADLVDAARTASTAAGMRHAVQGGRGTVMESLRRDRLALGYARAVSGSACAFCAMLASRGPVYSKDTAGFRSHNACTCAAEPVYTREADWPAGSRSHAATWDLAKSTAAEAGVSTATQFRRIHEGRA